MKTVLVVGSVNMDSTLYCEKFPDEGETIYGNAKFIQPGGKGANQAAALGKSKLVKVLFTAARGNDGEGRQIEQILTDNNVACRFKISNENTGSAFIVVDSKSENKIIIIPGANGDLFPKDIPDELIEQSDYLVLQNEIPAITNAHVIMRGHELGKIIVYNPAPFRKVEQSLLKYIDFLIVNRSELSGFSDKENMDEAIGEVLKTGIKNLIVTLGAKGSRFINHQEDYVVHAIQVKAIDTVAAGDTFVGYFVACHAACKSAKQAMETASKASAITVTRKGSIVSIPTMDEIDIR